jgi:hypothetical protein
VAGNFQRYCFVPARDDDRAIRALEKVLKRWPRRDIVLAVCLSLDSTYQRSAKELVIIDIIKDKKPVSDLFIL